ncbi:MAG: hypothetical protein HY704_08380 [Gemmatimonadetes bacterium]|nr:hypothetical protein [Gemmatimonadota bacterium]
MAFASDLSLRDRLWIRAYRFRRIEPLPWSPLRTPLPEATVALVTTAGLYAPEQRPFERIPGGDYSYRVIPTDRPLRELRISHPSRSWDRADAHADLNLVFPLDRLRELAGLGVIGPPAPRHFSFQGSITAPGRLVRRTAPEVAEALRADGVDGVVLVPV